VIRLLPSSAGVPAAPGVIFMEDWLAARWPDCCQPARCRCDCGCRAHSHYARCRDCGAGRHHPPRPVLVPLTARTAIAYAEWPPQRRPAAVDHLGHLRHLMRDAPEPVQ
jgi:hypothetical protein